MNMSVNKKQIANLNTDHQHIEKCMEKRLWSVFFAISLGCFFGGIFIILAYRIIICIIMYLKSKQSVNLTDPHTNLSHRRKQDGNEFHLLQKDTTPETTDENWISSTRAEMHKTTHHTKKCCSHCWSSIQHIFTQGRFWAIRLVSYDWIPGRIFIALSMIFSLTSFSIYAYEATIWPSEIEKCGHKGRKFRLLDFAMNIFFLLHFIVRLIASSDVLLFWIEWYSILDYLTIPPTLFGFFIKRTWIGFRFVRIFRLCNLPEVLNNLNIIKSASNLRMCQLCTLFISIWFAGAGFFNLFENTGNIFGSNTYNVSQPLPYTIALYYIIVTMSTVGYGDIVPQTYLGKAFISLFILFALATFASAIPEIVDMFFNVSKYSGIYQKLEGKSHIIVCGDITTNSVRTFLNDFLHEDRRRSDVEVVFINRSKPDLQLENLLRLHFLRVKYFRGSVMDHTDLQRVKMDSADACLILASATTKDPYQTDAANIMRVIAVKNFASHIRIIVQLLQTENKAYLLNSPYWNWECGDEIICFSELKLGFLAQSCIAPGFSTLVTNLFTMHSIHSNIWVYNYLHGASMEIYSAEFSIAFNGLQFTEAAIICRKYLDLLLIAVVAKVHKNTESYLNSSNKNVIIHQGTVGFFICDSQENANKVTYYCINCHTNNSSTTNVKSCSCQLKVHKSSSHLKPTECCKSKKDSKHNQQLTTKDIKTCLIIPELKEESEKTSNPSSALHQNDDNMAIISDKGFNESNSKCKTLSSRNSLHSAYDTEEYYSDVHGNQLRRSSDTELHLKNHTYHPTYEFDITGMYYYCGRQEFEDNLITSNSFHKQSHDLYNHILVCILAEPDAPLLGLHSFVMPLRASNFHPNQLKTILFLGDIKFLQREWSNIANFPKVYTLAGSPLSRADLRAARIQYSSVCVILGSRGTVKVDDPYMLDKEVILCTLNIRAMQFSPFHRHKTLSHNILKRRSGSEIPLITELMTDNNIHYLDPDHSGGLQIAASLTAPFAKGIAFTSSVLDVLASTAYFDRNSMTLIRHLVTGGVTPALEQWLAEGGGLIGHDDRRPFPGLLEIRQRPRIEQISLTNSRLIKTDNNGQITLFRNYGDLFCHAIQQYGILCLGIYRLSFNKFNGLSRLVTVPCSIKPKLNSTDESIQLIETKSHANCQNNDKQFAKLHRRLSTCGLPIDRVLRKHSLQLNRKSLSIEDTLQQQQQQQHDNPTSNQNTNLELIDQHFNKFGLNRYVISNPPNHFELYPTDVIFCLCPFESELMY
ncbi:calcium-activated potassium channel [Schistosoma mansoni]|uniref:calcium-activated potassium channel n=1 Tax=Schistosoma mansoni TaxID=6183 RepID=UPI0001A624F0|nr:calcium-activated potassium channel [Schistosoma mansoni]|eukprot:XP_018647290.1 calcium-activated potassium channel [Schistosoma mansoni]